MTNIFQFINAVLNNCIPDEQGSACTIQRQQKLEKNKKVTLSCFASHFLDYYTYITECFMKLHKR